MAESDLQGNTISEYVTLVGAGSVRINVSDSSAHYMIADMLRSTAVIAAEDGSLEQETMYGPYGEIRYGSCSGLNHYCFEGKERDTTETGFDYFGARYYMSLKGRWLTPDWSNNPVPIPFGILANPQTLNLYSFVQNNPLSVIDADGHAGGNACKGLEDCYQSPPDKNGNVTVTITETHATGPVIDPATGNSVSTTTTTTTTYTFNRNGTLTGGSSTTEVSQQVTDSRGNQTTNLVSSSTTTLTHRQALAGAVNQLGRNNVNDLQDILRDRRGGLARTPGAIAQDIHDNPGTNIVRGVAVVAGVACLAAGPACVAPAAGLSGVATGLGVVSGVTGAFFDFAHSVWEWQ